MVDFAAERKEAQLRLNPSMQWRTTVMTIG
jgi:hypothetical protein